MSQIIIITKHMKALFSILHLAKIKEVHDTRNSLYLTIGCAKLVFCYLKVIRGNMLTKSTYVYYPSRRVQWYRHSIKWCTTVSIST